MNPNYLSGVAVSPEANGPAKLLSDGSWCGHGEPLWRVFDIRTPAVRSFAVLLPRTEREREEDFLAPVVQLAPGDGGAELVVYDPRQHPASIYASDDPLPPAAPRAPYRCSHCDAARFRVAVGFEVPSDSDGPNDTSWFALSAACESCGTSEIVFEDETA